MDDTLVRLGVIVDVLRAHKRATALFGSLVILVPVLMWKSRDLERLETEKNRNELLARSFWLLYVGTCIQVALEIFERLS